MKNTEGPEGTLEGPASDMWTREKKTLEELNAALRAGEPPMYLMDYVLAHVTPSNFDAVLAQLDPKLQQHMVEYARTSFHIFDKMIEDLRKNHPLLSGQFASYKAWAHRQPWAAEELAKPKPVEWTEEQTQAFLDAEYANEVLAVSKRAQQEDVGKPNAAAWDPVIKEMEERAKRFADRADAIVPKKKDGS